MFQSIFMIEPIAYDSGSQERFTVLKLLRIPRNFGLHGLLLSVLIMLEIKT